MEQLIKDLEAATEGRSGLDERIYEAVKTDLTPPGHSYSQSLDAALTLVPEGCDWASGHGKNSDGDVVTFACVGKEDVAASAYDATASTPALALCIAALKAREQTA